MAGAGAGAGGGFAPGSGPLVAPCACSGHMKWVHLSCLRRWQRMALVSQSTHPDLWEDSPRHRECGVCKQRFTCPPPSRHELMESFTGPELGAMIDVDFIIASHERFSRQLQEQIDALGLRLGGLADFAPEAGGPGEVPSEFLEYFAEMCSEKHWVRGVYLIVEVEEDEGELLETIENDEDLAVVRQALGEDLSVSIRGDTYHLQPERSLRGAAPSGGGATPAERKEALAREFASLKAPANVVFRMREPGAPRNFANDHVVAVNLARPIADPEGQRMPWRGGPPGGASLRTKVEMFARRALEKVPDILDRIRLEHYHGGPCHDSLIQWCVLPGAWNGGTRGWVATPNLSEALLLSHEREKAVRERGPEGGPFAAGEGVAVRGLRKRPELNGEVGATLKWLKRAERWTVRLRNGREVKVKAENLQAWGPRERGAVMVFWGDARWTRTQLLGEIARGHWGMGKANVADILNAAEDRMAGLEGRLAFAPETEFTEEFMRGAQREMEALQGAAEVERSIRSGEDDAALLQDDAAGGQDTNESGGAGGNGGDGASSPRVGSRRPRP